MLVDLEQLKIQTAESTSTAPASYSYDKIIIVVAHYLFGRHYTNSRVECRGPGCGDVYINGDGINDATMSIIRSKISTLRSNGIYVSWTCDTAQLYGGTFDEPGGFSYDMEVRIPLKDVNKAYLIAIGEPCLGYLADNITERRPERMAVDDTIDRFFTIPGIKFYRMFNDRYNIPEIKKIYIGKKKKSTTIEWSDGTKTKVKCGFGDEYNLEAGINAAVVKKISRSTHYYYKHIKDKIVYTDKGKIMDKEDVLKVDDIPKNVEEK